MASPTAVDVREYTFQMVVDEILKPNGVKVGGYPHEMFVKLSEDEQTSYSCNICFLIANDARMCQNSHLFCNTCCFAWSLTYGENARKCPMCRCDQEKYLETKDVEKALQDRAVMCPEDKCEFKAPLKVFLMHSHGRLRYDNSNIDFESLRPQRRHPFAQLLLLPNLRAAAAAAENQSGDNPPTLRNQLQQGREMIHQMMLLLHLEMQLRQQAMFRFSRANNPNERVHIIDEVLALNEQLSEVGTVLSTLLTSQAIPPPPASSRRAGMIGLLAMARGGSGDDTPDRGDESDDEDSSSEGSISNFLMRDRLAEASRRADVAEREERIRQFREQLASIQSDDSDDETPVVTSRRALPDHSQASIPTSIHPRVLIGRPQESPSLRSLEITSPRRDDHVEIETITRLDRSTPATTHAPSDTAGDVVAGAPILPPIPASQQRPANATSQTSVLPSIIERSSGAQAVATSTSLATRSTGVLASSLATSEADEAAATTVTTASAPSTGSASTTPLVTSLTRPVNSLLTRTSSVNASTSQIIRNFASYQPEFIAELPQLRANAAARQLAPLTGRQSTAVQEQSISPNSNNTTSQRPGAGLSLTNPVPREETNNQSVERSVSRGESNSQSVERSVSRDGSNNQSVERSVSRGAANTQPVPSSLSRGADNHPPPSRAVTLGADEALQSSVTPTSPSANLNQPTGAGVRGGLSRVTTTAQPNIRHNIIPEISGAPASSSTNQNEGTRMSSGRRILSTVPGSFRRPIVPETSGTTTSSASRPAAAPVNTNSNGSVRERPAVAPRGQAERTRPNANQSRKNSVASDGSTQGAGRSTRQVNNGAAAATRPRVARAAAAGATGKVAAQSKAPAQPRANAGNSQAAAGTSRTTRARDPSNASTRVMGSTQSDATRPSGQARVMTNGPMTHGQLMRARRKSEIQRDMLQAKGQGNNGST